MIIVIDGPAGSGKSSTAKAVAEQLDIQYLDSGALYRAITFAYIHSGKSKHSFFDSLDEIQLAFEFQQNRFRIWLDKQEITSKIREFDVSEKVSEIASNPHVRKFVNKLMHEVTEDEIYIAEGRDLGTAVFPDAPLKFYMIADTQTRAKRRYEELKAQQKPVEFEKIKENIEQRDRKDSRRQADPLRQADDAIVIDTTDVSFDKQVAMIADRITNFLNTKQKQ